jgi:hypothetical protein
MKSHRNFAKVLRETMWRVEQNADVRPDHPDLLELKRILLQKIALIETGDAQSHPNSLASRSDAVVH